MRKVDEPRSGYLNKNFLYQLLEPLNLKVRDT